MPLNREFIGREYPVKETFEVGREHIRQFADAIGDRNPIYRDPSAAQAAGHPDVVAPPTFLTVLGFRFGADSPVLDPALGLDYSLVVHGEQKFELHRPVCAGDVLSTVSRVAVPKLTVGCDWSIVASSVGANVNVEVPPDPAGVVTEALARVDSFPAASIALTA